MQSIYGVAVKDFKRSPLQQFFFDCSRAADSKVIFSLFQNMEELQGAVIQAANALYHDFLKEDMAKEEYPSYKASGMSYIRFAREERELFKLLFMRDRSEEAALFQLEMWAYVHGIAAMIATSYLVLDEEMIGRMLTDAYLGLTARFCKKEEESV